MESKLKKVLQKIKDKIQNMYSDNFDKIYLYGSYARGESTSDSDVDLLVLLNQTDNRFKEVRKIYEEIIDLIIDYNKVFSIKITDKNIFDTHSNYSFFKNIIKEGKIL